MQGFLSVAVVGNSSNHGLFIGTFNSNEPVKCVFI